MAIDMSLQFDLMSVTVKRDEQMYGHKNNSESLLEAYFKDQNLRQQGKALSNENKTSASKKSSLVKKKKGVNNTIRCLKEMSEKGQVY